MDTIYTETHGTNCSINGERGVVRRMRYVNGSLVGAFVKLVNRDVMLYVTTGAATGERGSHHEVESVREIDRDEFDSLNGIDQLRSELGWR